MIDAGASGSAESGSGAIGLHRRLGLAQGQVDGHGRDPPVAESVDVGLHGRGAPGGAVGEDDAHGLKGSHPGDQMVPLDAARATDG